MSDRNEEDQRPERTERGTKWNFRCEYEENVSCYWVHELFVLLDGVAEDEGLSEPESSDRYEPTTPYNEPTAPYYLYPYRPYSLELVCSRVGQIRNELGYTVRTCLHRQIPDEDEYVLLTPEFYRLCVHIAVHARESVSDTEGYLIEISRLIRSYFRLVRL